jgi:hypothetical protein
MMCASASTSAWIWKTFSRNKGWTRLWPRQQLGKSRFIASIATTLKALFNQKEAIVTVIANEVKQSPIAAISGLPQSETFAAFP